jgi:hypothetical protein
MGMGQQKNGAPTDRRNRTLEVIVDELHSTLRRQIADIIKSGELLVEAKEHVGHGEWLLLLRQELSMSPRTAQRYMKAYEFVSAKNVTVAHLKLSPTALYLLSEDETWEDGWEWRGHDVQEHHVREVATNAVLKEAAVRRVECGRAREIIEETFTTEAQARAMSQELEDAKRQAEESGEHWEEKEPAWKAEWIRKNWDSERGAKFQAELERGGTQETVDESEAATATAEQNSKSGAASVTPGQTPEPDGDPAQAGGGSSSEHTRRSLSGIGRKEGRRGRAAAADQDSRRMEGFDQLQRLVEEIKQIVLAYDDRDRLMLRRGYDPLLDGFIDEKGKVRFKPPQHDADELPQSSGRAHGNSTVSPEQSAEDMKRKFEALDAASNAPADVASTS